MTFIYIEDLERCYFNEFIAVAHGLNRCVLATVDSLTIKESQTKFSSTSEESVGGHSEACSARLPEVEGPSQGTSPIPRRWAQALTAQRESEAQLPSTWVYWAIALWSQQPWANF